MYTKAGSREVIYEGLRYVHNIVSLKKKDRLFCYNTKMNVK